MKVRLIQPVGKEIRIFFKNKNRIVIPELYTMEAKLDDVRGDVDWGQLKKEYGEWLSWSLNVVYDNESGKPEPGDMFWHTPFDGSFDWDNFEGDELHAVLPNGVHWNIDSRAINCTMPKDREHRCWIRHGDPPNVTVGKKGGKTCNAGGGSIQGGDYHGFLRNGEFTK